METGVGTIIGAVTAQGRMETGIGMLIDTMVGRGEMETGGRMTGVGTGRAGEC